MSAKKKLPKLRDRDTRSARAARLRRLTTAGLPGGFVDIHAVPPEQDIELRVDVGNEPVTADVFDSAMSLHEVGVDQPILSDDPDSGQEATTPEATLASSDAGTQLCPAEASATGAAEPPVYRSMSSLIDGISRALGIPPRSKTST